MTDAPLPATIAEMDNLTEYLVETSRKANDALAWLALGQNGQRPQVKLNGWHIEVHLANGTTLVTRFHLESLATEVGEAYVTWPKPPEFPTTDRWSAHLDVFMAGDEFASLLAPGADPADVDRNAMLEITYGLMGDLRRHAVAAARRALIALNMEPTP